MQSATSPGLPCSGPLSLSMSSPRTLTEEPCLRQNRAMQSVSLGMCPYLLPMGQPREAWIFCLDFQILLHVLCLPACGTCHAAKQELVPSGGCTCFQENQIDISAN